MVDRERLEMTANRCYEANADVCENANEYVHDYVCHGSMAIRCSTVASDCDNGDREGERLTQDRNWTMMNVHRPSCTATTMMTMQEMERTVEQRWRKGASSVGLMDRDDAMPDYHVMMD